MDNTNLIKVLNELAKETENIIIQKIEDKKLIKTGALKASITYDIDSTGDIEFDMIYYGEYLDKGTKYITPRDFFESTINEQLDKYSDDIAMAIFEDKLNWSQIENESKKFK